MKHKKYLVKLIISEFFLCFGGLCFCYLCVWPIFYFFIDNKIKLPFFSSIEILDYKDYVFDILWLLLGTGLLVFLRIKYDWNKKTPKNIWNYLFG